MKLPDFSKFPKDGPLNPEGVAEYDITLNSADDLDGFYEDMKSSGYNMTLRRPISRTTAYEMTSTQVEDIKKDSRVLDIELKDPSNLQCKLAGSVNYDQVGKFGDWDKDSVDSTSDPEDHPWQQLHCAGTDAQRRYGTANHGGNYWNSDVVQDSLTYFGNGKHVDIVIVDTLIPYDMGEWYSTEDPSKNRFVQEDWFANYNSLVIGGLDQDLSLIHI